MRQLNTGEALHDLRASLMRANKGHLHHKRGEELVNTIMIILAFACGGHRLDGAIEPGVLVVRTRREEQYISGLIEHAVAKAQAPKPIDAQWVAIRPEYLAQEAAVSHIKGID